MSMSTWMYFILIYFLLLLFCFVMSRKYRNPYKLIMIFGKKGSGKTTLLVKLAVQYLRKGKKVYSTFYIPGTFTFEVNQIGAREFPRNSVIIIDEVGMIWDNRQFKNFRNDVRDWFKLQRQYRNIVILASQTFDIDVKLRNLTDQMYLCRCYMGFLTIARRIKRDIILVKPTGDSEARIADNLEFEPFWLSLFGINTMIITYIPHWSKVFKSFNPPVLAPIEGAYQEIPDHLTRTYHIRKKYQIREEEKVNEEIVKRNKKIWKEFLRLKGIEEPDMEKETSPSGEVENGAEPPGNS